MRNFTYPHLRICPHVHICIFPAEKISLALRRIFIAKAGGFIVIYLCKSGREVRFITGSRMDKDKLLFLQNKAIEIRKITIEMIGRLGS